MDFFNKLLAKLASESYQLHEVEAAIFLPTLIQESGHQKARFRDKFREMLHLVLQITTADKLVPFLLAGLNEKNTRSHVECLIILQEIAKDCGYAVLSKKGLRDIALCLDSSDKDVREHALTVLLQVHSKCEDLDQVIKLCQIRKQKSIDLLEARLRHLPSSLGVSKMKPKGTIRKKIMEQNNVQESQSSSRTKSNLPPRQPAAPKSENTRDSKIVQRSSNEKQQDVDEAVHEKADEDDDNNQCAIADLSAFSSKTTIVSNAILELSTFRESRRNIKNSSAQTIQGCLDAMQTLEGIGNDEAENNENVCFVGLDEMTNITNQFVQLLNDLRCTETLETLNFTILKGIMTCLCALYSKPRDVSFDAIHDLYHENFAWILHLQITTQGKNFQKSDQICLLLNSLVIKLTRSVSLSTNLNVLLEFLLTTLVDCRSRSSDEFGRTALFSICTSIEHVAGNQKAAAKRLTPANIRKVVNAVDRVLCELARQARDKSFETYGLPTTVIVKVLRLLSTHCPDLAFPIFNEYTVDSIMVKVMRQVDTKGLLQPRPEPPMVQKMTGILEKLSLSENKSTNEALTDLVSLQITEPNAASVFASHLKTNSQSFQQHLIDKLDKLELTPNSTANQEEEENVAPISTDSKESIMQRLARYTNKS